MMIADVAMKGREVSSFIPAIAAKICATWGGFTPKKIAAHIYGVAFELSPARIWQAFFGRKIS